MLACLACPRHGRDGQLAPACAGPLPIRCVLDERRHRRMPAVLSYPSVGTSSPCHSFDAGSGLMWPLIWPIPYGCCTITTSHERGLLPSGLYPLCFLFPGFSLRWRHSLQSNILSSNSSKMRFRRSSTVEEEDGGKKSSPIRLPMIWGNRHSVQEAKENIPPEHIDAHDSASSSPKASRRRTMIDFFKHKPAQKVDEEGENGLTRMSTQRTKSVSLRPTAGW